jgi:hypothetical protein
MKQKRYKYFANIDYAHQFMAGKVYHQTLAYFRDYEDHATQQVIGDEFESTRLFRPPSGLVCNNLTQGISFPLQMGFESSVKAGEIFVFCFSFALSDELIRKFGAVAVVEITRPAAFINRWIAALPPAVSRFAKKVDYYRREHGPANVWPQPELIATTKLAHFSYQREYRLGFSTTGALAFGEATQKLVDRKTRPLSHPHEHHSRRLELGDLSDICFLHDLRLSLSGQTTWACSI